MKEQYLLISPRKMFFVLVECIAEYITRMIGANSNNNSFVPVLAGT